MIIFKNIEIENFRNIKHIKLEDLRDLNILIVPNNCGKTNFLEFISLMSGLSYGTAYPYLCTSCQSFMKSTQGIIGIYLYLTTEDFYLGSAKRKMKISFLLNEEEINRLVPATLKKQRDKLGLRQNSKIICEYIKDEIVMKNKEGESTLYAEHLSPFIEEGIIDEIKKSILYCPEKRLQSYKGKEFAEYIRERQLSIAQKRKWIDFLQKVIDPKIDDERYERLIRKIDGEDFETEISKQGSGVRSLICLAIDILFDPEKRIVLIDEPELGLNPFVKQEFLSFLLNESKERQIFIATQDPTFVNPILWRNNNVSVYFYSAINEDFIKIDLEQNKEDPDVFAGYMPHTTSLKDIHIYVEGTSDVYIFQILLEKYLKKYFPENWFELFNKVGIYHLCGDFWSHLLYTIPKFPYKCIIILDGDKRKEAEEICKKYKDLEVITSKFVFCKSIEDIAENFGKEKHPVYCLKENCIEKYLMPEFDCTKIPKDYNKRRDGPKKAEELQEIPEEIENIFSVILKKTGKFYYQAFYRYLHGLMYHLKNKK
jgi:AAA15 family ATPase/GTPase